MVSNACDDDDYVGDYQEEECGDDFDVVCDVNYEGAWCTLTYDVEDYDLYAVDDDAHDYDDGFATDEDRHLPNRTAPLRVRIRTACTSF